MQQGGDEGSLETMEEAEETADRQLRLLEEDYRRTIMAGRQRSREEEEDAESRDALAVS